MVYCQDPFTFLYFQNVTLVLTSQRVQKICNVMFNFVIENKIDNSTLFLLMFILCIEFKQETVCTSTVITMWSRRLCSFTIYTQLFITVCLQLSGNQGCSMGSSSGSANSNTELKNNSLCFILNLNLIKIISPNVGGAHIHYHSCLASHP